MSLKLRTLAGAVIGIGIGIVTGVNAQVLTHRDISVHMAINMVNAVTAVPLTTNTAKRCKRRELSSGCSRHSAPANSLACAFTARKGPRLAGVSQQFRQRSTAPVPHCGEPPQSPPSTRSRGWVRIHPEPAGQSSAGSGNPR